MITYVNGDATRPIGKYRHNFICHVCNDIGGWGKGFVLAISKRWKEPEIAYRGMQPLVLGNIQCVRVEDNITVINMIAQHKTYSQNGIPPIRYNALDMCLLKISQAACASNINDIAFHMPRIGCGLAGGDWKRVSSLIDKHLSQFPVIIYDLNTQ